MAVVYTTDSSFVFQVIPLLHIPSILPLGIIKRCFLLKQLLYVRLISMGSRFCTQSTVQIKQDVSIDSKKKTFLGLRPRNAFNKS